VQGVAGPTGAAGATGATGATGPAGSAGSASDVAITDSGGYFTSTDVEGALQELGADVAGAGSLVIFDSKLLVDAANIDTGVLSIPAGTKALEILISARTAKAAATDALAVLLNNDATAGHYLTRFVFFNGGSGQSLQTAVAGWYTECPGNSAGAGAFNSTVIKIPDPLSTSKIVSAAIDTAWTDGSNWTRNIVSGFFLPMTGISRIAIVSVAGANLKAGSRLTVLAYT
jgi:hypothetical protein